MNQMPTQPTPVSTPTPPQGSKSALKWLLIILVLLILAGGGYYYYIKYYNTGTTPVTASPTPTKSMSASPSIPATWKTYTNSQYKFSFKYPGDWTQENVTKSQYVAEGVKFNSPETIAEQSNHKGPAPVGPDIKVEWYQTFADFLVIHKTGQTNPSTIDGWFATDNIENITKITNSYGVSLSKGNVPADPPYSLAIASNTNGNIILLAFEGPGTTTLDTSKSTAIFNSTADQILSTFQFTK